MAFRDLKNHIFYTVWDLRDVQYSMFKKKIKRMCQGHHARNLKYLTLILGVFCKIYLNLQLDGKES